MERRHAFVTGATGFIGLNLVRYLLDRQWDVTALHRRTSDPGPLADWPVRLCEGSVTNPGDLKRAITGEHDVVFHLAGDTGLWAARNERQTKVNVKGTENVARAARHAGVSCLIHTSSASSWGEYSNRTISEELPQKGGTSWVNYERTKWASERVAIEEAGDGVKVVILNPTVVTGPYDRNNWGQMFIALKKGSLPGIPDGIISVNHVDEVVRAHVRAMDRARHAERYLLSGVDCTIREFVSEIAGLTGVSALPRRIPTALLNVLAYTRAGLARVTGNAPVITPELVRLMTRRNIRYSSKKAERELGYRILPLSQTLRDCHRWLKKEELI